MHLPPGCVPAADLSINNPCKMERTARAEIPPDPHRLSLPGARKPRVIRREPKRSPF